MPLTSPQPRLRLYTKPSVYMHAGFNLLRTYSPQNIKNAEQQLCEFTGAKHAVLTSLGRTAIYEGLNALFNPGDEIIVSPMTVPEVVSMMDLVGVVPVFCDTVPGTWNMDWEKIESLITDKTKAIMTTHLYGFADTVKPVQDLCRKYGLLFLEDAAQALSTRVDGKMAGTFGTFGIYSFSYPKNVCTFYGGVLVTDDDDLAGRVRQNISNYPDIDKRFYYKRVVSSLIKDFMTMDVIYPWIVSRVIQFAYKYDISFLKSQVEVHLPVKLLDHLPPPYATKVSGLQGQLVLKKLPDVEREARHRINAALIYDQGLKGISEIIRPKFYPDFMHTYLYYPIQVPDRIGLMKYLISRKRDVAYQHIPNCASEKAFHKYAADCPNAERAASQTLTLPTYGKLRLDEVEKIVAVIREYFGKAKYSVN